MPTAEPVALPWGSHRPGVGAAAIIAVSRHSWLGRGAMRKRLFRLLTRLHTGPVDTWLWGQRVRLFPDRNVSERKALLRPNRLDQAEYAFVRHQLARPRPVFVDVGANAGLYSLYAALTAAAGARILAIEPDPGLLARLRFNLELARTAGGPAPGLEVALAAVAVSDRDGEGRLATDGDEGSRSLTDGGGRPVPLRRMAALLEEHGIGRVTLMKIDVEGYEDRVLPPYLAEVSEERWPEAIIIEHVHRQNWTVDCLALCQSRGYRVCAVTNNNTLLERAR